jgi:Ca2+-binding RTX toxin-like protein
VGNIAGNNTSEIAQSLLQISSSGVSVGAPTMVNTTTATHQLGPVIAALSEGRYFIAWYDSALSDPAGGVRGQFYKADGTKDGGEIAVGSQRVDGGNQMDLPALSVTSLDDDQVVVSWISEAVDNIDGSGSAAMQVIVSPNYGGLSTGGGSSGSGGASGSIVNVEHIIGTAAADVLKGDAAANTITAGDGNDRVIGTAGADVINLGAGDDEFVYNSSVNQALNVDGGAGFDTLVVDGGGLHLDFTSALFVAGGAGVRNIEAVKLGGSGANRLTLTAQDVLNLSSTTDVLIVFGDADDRVTANGFVATGATQQHSGRVLNVYTHSATPGAELWVEQGMPVL